MRTALAFLLLCVVVTALLWRGDDAPTPPSSRERNHPTTTADHAAARALDAPAATPAIATSTGNPDEPAREHAPPAGLFGRVLDDRGDPIANLLVRLIPHGAPDRDGIVQATRGDGSFAYPGVHGRFLLHTYNHLSIRKTVLVPEGTRIETELQANEPCVLLYGYLRRGKQAIPDRSVFVHGTDHVGNMRHESPTDDHGYFHHLLRPGTYRLTIAGPPTGMEWSIKGTPVWGEASGEELQMVELVLSAAERRVRQDLQLPQSGVAMLVKTTDASEPIADAYVTCKRLPDGAPTWTRRTGEDGRTIFRDLDAGTYEIRAHSPLHVAAASLPKTRTIEVRPGDQLQSVELRLARAGQLLVKLHDQGQLYEPLGLDGLKLHLTNGETVIGKRSEGGMWVYEGTRFQPVPVGTHQLSGRDRREADGAMHFVSFVPFGNRPATIVAGECNELILDRRRRPRLSVELRQGDMRLPGAVITVRSPTDTIASHTGNVGQWNAPLPPGDYTVQVQHGEKTWTELVTVLNEDVLKIIEGR